MVAYQKHTWTHPFPRQGARVCCVSEKYNALWASALLRGPNPLDLHNRTSKLSLGWSSTQLERDRNLADGTA
jgi:hypothetical protein